MGDSELDLAATLRDAQSACAAHDWPLVEFLARRAAWLASVHIRHARTDNRRRNAEVAAQRVATNNYIDLLLRRLSDAEGAPPSLCDEIERWLERADSLECEHETLTASA